MIGGLKLTEKCYKCGYEFNDFSYKAKQYDENGEFIGYACNGCVDGSKMKAEDMKGEDNTTNSFIHNPENIDEKVQYFKLNRGYLSIHGRFGRLQYFLHWLGLVLISCVSIFLIISSGAGAIIGLGYSSSFPAVLSSIGLMFGIGIALVAFIGSITITIKRFHDFNQSGAVAVFVMFLIWLIGLFIPFIGLILNIIFFLFLVIIRGNYGPNMYGEDPVSNV